MSYTAAAGWRPGDPIESIPPEVIREARDWVEDCQWREEPGVIEEYPDDMIARGVNRWYDGGWSQFVRDSHYHEMEMERGE